MEIAFGWHHSLCRTVIKRILQTVTRFDMNSLDFNMLLPWDHWTIMFSILRNHFPLILYRTNFIVLSGFQLDLG